MIFCVMQASDLTIEETKNPKEKLSPEKLVFGKNFTDHMLEVFLLGG